MLSCVVSMGSSASASEGPAGYKKAISWPTTRTRCGGVAAQFIESHAVPIYDAVVVQRAEARQPLGQCSLVMSKEIVSAD